MRPQATCRVLSGWLSVYLASRMAGRCSPRCAVRVPPFALQYRCLPCNLSHVAPCCPVPLVPLALPCLTPIWHMLSSSFALLSRPAHRGLLGLRPAHRACIHHMSAPAPLPDNSIKELVGDASTTESLLACKIGGCCGKDTPLLSLPVSDPFCPSQLEGVHNNRHKPEPRLGPAQALHDRLSAIPRWRLSGDETVISRALC